MRSAYVDLPWWLGLLIGASITGIAVVGLLVDRRSDGSTRRSHLVWGTVAVVVGGLFVLDALV